MQKSQVASQTKRRGSASNMWVVFVFKRITIGTNSRFFSLIFLFFFSGWNCIDLSSGKICWCWPEPGRRSMDYVPLWHWTYNWRNIYRISYRSLSYTFKSNLTVFFAGYFHQFDCIYIMLLLFIVCYMHTFHFHQQW